jgi:hypothetical protein
MRLALASSLEKPAARHHLSVPNIHPRCDWLVLGIALAVTDLRS